MSRAVRIHAWQQSLIRLLYPRCGATPPLCLAAGLSPQVVALHARGMGVPPPALCVECHANPRPTGRGGRQTCERCRERKRRRNQPPAPAQSPRPQLPPRPRPDEALLARSRQLAESLDVGQPVTRHDLPGLGLVEAAVLALVAAAPHWYEGCLKWGLSLSAEGLWDLLGRAPAPTEAESLALERDALAARVQAMEGGLAALAEALELLRATRAQREASQNDKARGKAAPKRRRRDSAGQLLLFDEVAPAAPTTT